MDNPSEECIPLFLNSFGEYDGFGVYQLVEDIILKFKHEVVIHYLRESLKNEHKGVRYWCAQIALLFPDDLLVEPLSSLLMDENSDIRMAATMALMEISNPIIKQILDSHLSLEIDNDIKELITDAINNKE